MQDIIGRLELVGIKPDGITIDIVAQIGKPYSISQDEWACPVSLEPLYGKLHDAHGGDSFQAICLAIGLIMNLLLCFVEDGGKLSLKGEETQASFPFDAYFSSAAKRFFAKTNST